MDICKCNQKKGHDALPYTIASKANKRELY